MRYQDPETYRKLAEPFETADDLDEAIDEFDARVRELREELGLTNVVVIVGSSYRTDGGDESEAMAMFTMGDALRPLPMIAWAYGREGRTQRDIIGELLKGSQ